MLFNLAEQTDCIYQQREGALPQGPMWPESLQKDIH